MKTVIIFTFALIISIVNIFAFNTIAYTQEYQQRHMHKKAIRKDAPHFLKEKRGIANDKIKHFLNKLNLNKEQKKNLLQLKPKLAELKETEHNTRLRQRELKRLIQSGNFNEADILGKLNNLNSAIIKGNNVKVRILLELRRILTPEQYNKVISVIGKRLQSDSHNRRFKGF